MDELRGQDGLLLDRACAGQVERVDAGVRFDQGHTVPGVVRSAEPVDQYDQWGVCGRDDERAGAHQAATGTAVAAGRCIRCAARSNRSVRRR